MKNDTAAARNWEEILAQKDAKIARLETLVKYYEGQLRLAAQKRFGASSEKTDVGQISLFDEAENTADRKIPEPEFEQIAYIRKKQVGKREEDLSGLHVEAVEYELPESERTCPECGEPLHTMGKETRRELIIVPAQIKVKEHIRRVYSCRNCEKNNDHTPIVKAPAPEAVIKGSIASPSAVAHIMTEKYVTHTPLYRQEAEWKRRGIALSRQTMANWIIRCTEDWLEPIYERLRRQLLKNDVLHADETTLQVLREPGKKANTNSYMWLYRTSGCADRPIALYEYQPTRSSGHPKRFWDGWKGFLHTDGYAGYNALPNIIPVGCWAHMRRKFDETMKSTKPEDRQNTRAQEGLDCCNRLFALEREFEAFTPMERQKARELQSRPVAEALFAWADALNALPKSPLGRALEYAAGQRNRLMNVFLDGRLELSNNRAERSIKPFVIGRKNWLFCNTPKGARASSVIYSVMETAKENSLKPFDYLKFLLETAPITSTGALDDLLPWSNAVPELCRAGK